MKTVANKFELVDCYNKMVRESGKHLADHGDGHCYKNSNSTDYSCISSGKICTYDPIWWIDMAKFAGVCLPLHMREQSEKQWELYWDWEI